MNDYGVFNAEGLIDGPFPTLDAAWQVAEQYPVAEEAIALELCADHPENAAANCEECYRDA